MPMLLLISWVCIVLVETGVVAEGPRVEAFNTWFVPFSNATLFYTFFLLFLRRIMKREQGWERRNRKWHKRDTVE